MVLRAGLAERGVQLMNHCLAVRTCTYLIDSKLELPETQEFHHHGVIGVCTLRSPITSYNDKNARLLDTLLNPLHAK